MSSDLKSNNSQFNFKMEKPRRNRIYKFEDFRLDAAHLLLYQNGREVSLTPKVIETLLALVERSGKVLSKNELMEIVWADSFVEDGNLSQNLYLLRKVLQKKTDGAPLIETLKRRGYRFNGAVSCVEEKPNGNSSPDKNQSARRKNVWKSADRKANERAESADGNLQLNTVKPANAFEACQMARLYFQQITLPGFIKSRELIDEAVRLDAEYAPAYVALAEQCLKEAIYGLSTPAEGCQNARNALARAVELKADSAEFYAAKGFVKLVADWDFAGAKRNLQKSLAINPHCAFANNYMGQTFLFRCKFEKAETYLRRAVKIEPTGLYNRGMLTVGYFLARKYQKSIEECEKYLTVSPQAIPAEQIRCWNLEQTGRAAEAVAEYEKRLDEPHGAFTKRWLGIAYALNNEEEKARAIAAELAAESREHYFSPIHSAMLHAALNETDEAVQYLETALESRDPWMLWLSRRSTFRQFA